jgi:hypothetical protein
MTQVHGGRVGSLLGVAVAGATAVLTLAACGAGGEGTVVAKTERAVYDYSCQAGGSVTGPVAVPAWGTCSVPECWLLVVRDRDGTTSEPCVSRAEYDRTRVGAFRHGRTDRVNPTEGVAELAG